MKTDEEKFALVLELLISSPDGITHLDTEPHGIGEEELAQIILALSACDGSA